MLTIEMQTNMFRNKCEKQIAELYAVHKKVTENYSVYDLKLCKLNKLQIAILDKVANYVEFSDEIQKMDLSALTIHAGRLDYLLTELRKIECIVRFNLQLHNNYINGTMDKFPAYLKKFTKHSKILHDTFETYSNLDQILPTNASFYSNDVACFKKPSRVRFAIPE